MRILLDTHILLWWLAGDPALPEAAAELIRDPENVVFVSAVSIWEISLKQSLGKLDLHAAAPNRGTEPGTAARAEYAD